MQEGYKRRGRLEPLICTKCILTMHPCCISIVNYANTKYAKCLYEARREGRVCKECGNVEVKDVDHFVMRCKYLA